MTSLALWRNMWLDLGASATSESLFHELVDCYSEPHRKYHTMQHLAECFAHLERVRAIAERPSEIALALWFHDAIYNTNRKDNEERSAAWARECVLSADLSSETAERLFGLVMATKHNAIPSGTDAQVLIDIDLGILGADSERFDEYECQVREEYPWVPGPLYRRERRRILQEFASRPSVYCTEYFRASYEARARDNLARSLARL